MHATIICTGEELLCGRVADTNSAFIAAQLRMNAVSVRHMVTVGDDPADMHAAIAAAAARSDLVVVTGGLGPTADDRTRYAVAEAAGLALQEDAATIARIEQRLKAYGHSVDEHQRTQALFPVGSTVFPNEMGTAAGFACQTGNAWIVVLPGPPSEMRPMLTGPVQPFLQGLTHAAGAVAFTTLHLFPIAEPDADRRIRDMMAPGANPVLGITVSDGIITISIQAHAATQQAADDMLNRTVATVRERFDANLIFGTDGTSLAGALAIEMETRALTLSVAESLTGGLIGEMLVSVPGMSRFLLADIVAYSNAAKTDLLGVPEPVIAEHGAVSAPTAEAMARGACRATGAQLGISTTGIAGPGGATPDKPVGLAWIGICLDGETAAVRLNVRGSRRRVMDRVARCALHWARICLRCGLDSLPREHRM